MGVNIKKYPLYIYDEPAVYTDFTGGINTNPNNDQLADNEMRDALNMDYNARDLVKRKGATQIGSMISEEPLENIQGIFLFTYRITYLIVAANGRLYSGVFNKNSTTNLNKLPILVTKPQNDLSIDPEYLGHGLDTREDVDSNIKHEGYLQDIEVNGLETKELIFQNTRNIEAATYNNKLFITTGTRFIEVFLEENQLKANPVRPYEVNNVEYTKIGENHLSPFPHLARNSAYNQVNTSIGGVRVSRTTGGTFLLEPLMMFFDQDTEDDYYYRWEKFIDGEWYVIKSFKDNSTTDGDMTIKVHQFTLEVNDADRYKYRVTFCETFKTDQDPETGTVSLVENEYTKYFPGSDSYETINDYEPDKAEGGYFGQATSVRFDPNLDVSDRFIKIQSCTKITSDGNKFLLYGDRYNSGSWFKTVIDNPSYTSYRGDLSFKTDKNEELIKVVPFSNNLIAFANSDNVGGSIHLIQGNGDDVPEEYYSPYRRKTINASISCDNVNTIQVAGNLLLFKYFKNIYYIRSSELSNEVIKIYTANDKIKMESRDVQIPWDDNTCISEITEDYYALIWKEKYILQDDELILDHPSMKIKMYYKIERRTEEGMDYPWLRDESKFFNIDHILYLEGKPVYLYNNILITYSAPVYTDMGEDYSCNIHFRGMDLNYPKMFKVLDNVLISYHINHFGKTSFNTVVRNEAGHVLIDSEAQKKTLQDLRGLRIGAKLDEEESYRLDKTILDSRLLRPDYKFPCLLAETSMEVITDREFSISSITYNYSVLDVPTSSPYELYSSILRKKEVL